MFIVRSIINRMFTRIVSPLLVFLISTFAMQQPVKLISNRSRQSKWLADTACHHHRILLCVVVLRVLARHISSILVVNTCMLVCIPGRNGVKGKVELSDRTRTIFAKGYPLKISLSSITKGYGYLRDFP
jgi:hypothetical protein